LVLQGHCSPSGLRQTPYPHPFSAAVACKRSKELTQLLNRNVCSAVHQIDIASLQNCVAWLSPHLFAVPGVCCRFLSSVKDMFR